MYLLIKNQKINNIILKILLFLLPLIVITQLVESKERELKLFFLILSIALIFLTKNRKNKNILFLFKVIFIIDIYILVLSIFNIDYLFSYHFIPINMSLFFYYMGSKLSFEKNIKPNIKYFLISLLILSIYIYLNFFLTIDFNRAAYVYSQKNSTGPLLVIGILLSSYLFQLKKKRKEKILLIVLSIIFLAILLFIKNRTGILGLFLAELYFFRKKIKIKKILKMFLFIIPILGIYYNKIIFFFNWALGLTHRISKNTNMIDNLSSGRGTLIKQTIPIIIENPIIGVGKYYLDLSYLMIWASYGIIGFILFMGLIVFFIKIFNESSKNREGNIKKAIIIYMLTTTLFEGIMPYGPGTSFLLLWLILGSSLENKKNSRK